MTVGRNEKLVDKRVTYTLKMEGKFHSIENVPARVDEETDAQFFAPSTVEHLQKTILGQAEPSKVIETPVYEYRDEMMKYFPSSHTCIYVSQKPIRSSLLISAVITT